MRRALLVVLLVFVGCGKVTGSVDARPITIDGPSADAAGSSPDARTPDATPVVCTYVASTATSPLLTYAFAGGSSQSFGCAPVDPTYWLAGAGGSVTITFTNAQDRPSIRVWGMNDDDIASIKVNGNAYALTASSASIAPKVTCGVSPGPDGVVFTGGNLVGANSNSAGNYSYNDVTLEKTGVDTIEVDGLAGAGWGFAGVSVGCAP